MDIVLPAEGVFQTSSSSSAIRTRCGPTKPCVAFGGIGQMMFTKYLVVADDDVDVHNTSEVLFRLCANTSPFHSSLLDTEILR